MISPVSRTEARGERGTGDAPLEVVHKAPSKVCTDVHAILFARREDRGSVSRKVLHTIVVRESLLERHRVLVLDRESILRNAEYGSPGLETGEWLAGIRMLTRWAWSSAREI